jgi:hypothetical protein
MNIFTLLVTIMTMLAAYFKKATSIVGISETKEAVVAINEIGLFCASKFKDGVQVTDFVSFYAELTTNEDFKAKIKAGYDNAKAIPSEIKDIDGGEALELASVQVGYVEKYIAAFKA